MVRRVNIACKKAHICSPPVDYIAVRVHKVFVPLLLKFILRIGHDRYLFFNL